MTASRPTPTAVERSLGAGVLLVLGLGPLFLADYWVSFILTQTFLLGIAAASMIFLSAYGGMVSLAQTALFGISGFTMANAVTTGVSFWSTLTPTARFDSTAPLLARYHSR